MAQNPPTDPNPQATLTLVPPQLRDGNDQVASNIGNYTYIQGTSSNTKVSVNPGLLFSITVNTPVASGTIKLYDEATTGTSGLFATITFPSGAQVPVTLFFNCVLLNGLWITPSSSSFDITVTMH